MADIKDNKDLAASFEKVAKGNFAPYLNEHEIIRLYTEAILAQGSTASKEEIAEYVRTRFSDFNKVELQFQSPVKLRFGNNNDLNDF